MFVHIFVNKNFFHNYTGRRRRTIEMDPSKIKWGTKMSEAQERKYLRSVGAVPPKRSLPIKKAMLNIVDLRPKQEVPKEEEDVAEEAVAEAPPPAPMNKKVPPKPAAKQPVRRQRPVEGEVLMVAPVGGTKMVEDPETKKLGEQWEMDLDRIMYEAAQRYDQRRKEAARKEVLREMQDFLDSQK